MRTIHTPPTPASPRRDRAPQPTGDLETDAAATLEWLWRHADEWMTDGRTGDGRPDDAESMSPKGDAA